MVKLNCGIAPQELYTSYNASKFITRSSRGRYRSNCVQIKPMRVLRGCVLTTWIGELESAETDIVEGFIVKNHALVGVLDQLVDGEGGVVRLNHGVRHLG